MTVEELFNISDIQDSSIVEVLDLSKYNRYLETLDWKEFCNMYVIRAQYGDIKKSEVYEQLKKFNVYDKYKKSDTHSLVILIDEPERKVKEFMKKAKCSLVMIEDIFSLDKKERRSV